MISKDEVRVFGHNINVSYLKKLCQSLHERLMILEHR